MLDEADEPLPEAIAHVWTWFRELDETRESNGFSLQPITYREIEAWDYLRQRHPEPWELEAILLIDKAKRASRAEWRAKEEERARNQRAK